MQTSLLYTQFTTSGTHIGAAVCGSAWAELDNTVPDRVLYYPHAA